MTINGNSVLRRLLFVPPVLVGAFVLWFAVANRAAPERAPQKELSARVRVIEAAKLTVVPRITGYGTAKPAKSWAGIAQVGGRVTYVNPKFQQGAILEQGTELIRISEEDYKLAIAEAEAQIRQAQAKRDELKVTKTNTEQLLRIEKDSLELKQNSVDAKRRLLKRGTVAQLSFDNELRDLLAQKKKVQDLENALRLLPTQLSVQEEQIRVSEAKLATAKLNLARTSIKLPFRARIASVDVEISQYVQPGARIGAADGVKATEVNAQFPIARLRRFIAFVRHGAGLDGDRNPDAAGFAKRTGLHAIVRLNAGERDVTWRADVDRTNDTIDEKTRTVGVIAVVQDSYAKSVPGQKPPLVKGMFVEVDLRARPIEGQIAVPPGAVHGDTVYVADGDGRLELRKVEVGYAGPGYVIIDSGLSAGEQVVVSDVSPVIAGMLLNTVRDQGLETQIAAAASADPLAAPAASVATGETK